MPKKKTVALVVLGFVLLVAGAAGILIWLVLATPEFYQQALAEVEALAPEERTANAEEFEQQAEVFATRVYEEETWSERFTQTQINSWLMERLQGEDNGWTPKNVSDPRVVLQQETVLLGFQYQHPKFSGIVSLEVKPKLRSPRELALEVQSVKAGTLPLPVEEIMEPVTERLRNAKEWNVRLEQGAAGEQLVVLEFEADLSRQPNLEQLTIVDGAIEISGSTATEDGETESRDGETEGQGNGGNTIE